MKPEITSIFGPPLKQEVSTLLEKLVGMTNIFEANLFELKDFKKYKEE